MRATRRRRAVRSADRRPCPICPAAPRSRPSSTTPSAPSSRAALPGLKERAKTLVELLDGARFLFAERPLAMDAKAAEILAKGGRLHLAALLPRLAAIDGLERGGDRRRPCAPMPRRRRQARRRRPAAARRADRPLDLAGHLRRAGGAGARGEPGAARGSGARVLRAPPTAGRLARPAPVVFLSHPPGMAR